MAHRVRTFVYALAILLNAFVAVWWGVLGFAIVRQHDFTLQAGELSVFIVPLAAASALVALMLKLRN